MKVAVKVIPRSGRQELEVVGERELRCYIKNPPEDGKANRELTEFLAQILRIPKRSVAVVQGFASRTKVVEIVGFADWETVLGVLTAQR